MKFEKWTVAYRKRSGGKTILDDTNSPFYILANNWRYWAGDPFLIEYNGETWVFAELYDRVLRKGVIGCCKIPGSGAFDWKPVLRMPYHLSYPHLFILDGNVYMIPESYVADEIAVYRAVEFPYRWEKVKVLKDHYCAVDSTIFQAGHKKWMLTLRLGENREKLMLFPVDDSELSGEGFCVSENDSNKRPAGNFFVKGERLIRPAQDCTESYGCALNFYEVTAVSEDRYEEHLVRKIIPGEIKSDLKGSPAGLHTYNASENYEVIDLKEYEFDWLLYIMRPIWFVWRRIRKVFGK